MQKILVISGKKQSGKTSASNFIHGYILREEGVFEDFGVHPESGDLVVPEGFRDAGGKMDKRKALFSFGEDRVLTEPYYVEFAHNRIWQHVKRYSFADSLKKQAIQLFNMSVEQCYGSDKQKNSKSTVKWSYIARVLGNKEAGVLMGGTLKKGERWAKKLDKFMTAREFLQVYGTQFCRAINPDCWLDATVDKVLGEQVPIAIIDDARFPNEIDKVIKLKDTEHVDVKTVRLERDIFNDTHGSETALDDHGGFDLVVPPECGLDEKHELILEALHEWGWV